MTKPPRKLLVYTTPGPSSTNTIPVEHLSPPRAQIRDKTVQSNRAEEGHGEIEFKLLLEDIFKAVNACQYSLLVLITDVKTIKEEVSKTVNKINESFYRENGEQNWSSIRSSLSFENRDRN